jgi:hypothetical protein
MLVYFMSIWSILRPFGVFYGHLVHFTRFGTFEPIMVFCIKKNLATLVGIAER